MGGIRKKTSKRGTTFQGFKIKKKAAETRKKNARAARKDVTWKSKKTKDPGIPANFPYKDQVLAELAEQKRAAEEAKEARKLAQKEAAAGKFIAQAEDSDDDNPGIITLHNRNAVNPRVAANETAPAVAAEDPPPLVDTELPTIQAALDRADAVIQVLDARDPQSFRSAFLENLITETGGKDKLLFVLNKVDLVPRESSAAWLRHLRASIPIELRGSIKACLLKSSVKSASDLSEGMQSKAVPWGRSRLLAILEQWAAEKLANNQDDKGFTVTVMGLPNVGKSALINTLLSRPFLPTAIMPTTSQKGNTTTTLTPIEVSLSTSEKAAHAINVIDTPGWEFNDPDINLEGEREDDEDEDEEDEEDADMADDLAPAEKWDLLETYVTKDILTRNVGRVDKIKDPYPLARHIISRANSQDLMLAYNVPAFQRGDVRGFLVNLARSQGRLRKHGVADLDAAAKTILRDWAFNEFPYYTMPPKAKDGSDASISLDDDEEVLQLQRTRKEMRSKGKGLIRLESGLYDDRELILDEEFELEGADESDEDEDDDDMLDESMLEEADLEDLESDSDDEDVEEEDDVEQEDEEDEEDEPTPPPAPPKGKRRRHSSPQPPPAKKAKKVEFSASIERPKSPKSATPKAVPSSILKRKARAHDEDEEVDVREAKKRVKKDSIKDKETNGKIQAAKPAARPAPKVEQKAVNGTAPKAASGKSKLPAAAAVAIAKPRSKATENAGPGEKPYDFAAHFF